MYGCIKNCDKSVCTDIITARMYNIEQHFSSKYKDVSEMPNKEKSESCCIILKKKINCSRVLFQATIMLDLPDLLQLGTNGKPFIGG